MKIKKQVSPLSILLIFVSLVAAIVYFIAEMIYIIFPMWYHFLESILK